MEGQSKFRLISRDEFCDPELQKLFSGFIVEDHISKNTNIRRMTDVPGLKNCLHNHRLPQAVERGRESSG
jgi:hypothetical protein